MTLSSLLVQYAELLLVAGLSIKAGDKLIIKFNQQQLPFVRLLTEKAYQLGVLDIYFDFQDDDLVLARYRHSSPTNHSYYPKEHAEHLLALYQAGYCQLTLIGANPQLLSKISPTVIGSFAKARQLAMKEVMQYGMANHNKWLVAGVPTIEWASKVFPDELPEKALTNLWQLIFKACHLTTSKNTNAGFKHLAALEQRAQTLTSKQYNCLHFYDGKSDLTIGLPANHLWAGGSEVTTNGETFISNLPVEEVWTMPDRNRVNGSISLSKPFSYHGVTINSLTLWFIDGKVSRFESDQPEIIQSLLTTDTGAAYLGEIALVPNSSPLNQSDLIYYQTLFDENTASHLALGQAYESNLLNATTLSKTEQSACGMNHSAIHQDIMIGNQHMTVTGIFTDGTCEKIMENGEWLS